MSGDTLDQLRLSGLTHFWVHLGSTPIGPAKIMFMDVVKGRDHQSQEFIVKLKLINDVPRNSTCSRSEISI